MRINEPLIFARETYVEIPISAFFVESQAALELNLQKGFAVVVLRYEIRSFPITADTNRHKPILGEHRRDLLKIERLLLPRIQLAVLDPFKRSLHLSRLCIWFFAGAGQQQPEQRFLSMQTIFSLIENDGAWRFEDVGVHFFAAMRGKTVHKDGLRIGRLE